LLLFRNVYGGILHWDMLYIHFDRSENYYPAPDTIEDGVLFLIDFFVYFYMYLSFFVSLLARLRENSWTDLHEIFREGVE